MRSTSDVTDLLDEWNRGNSHALDELLPLIYAELRRVAARQLRAERAAKAWLVRELGLAER